MLPRSRNTFCRARTLQPPTSPRQKHSCSAVAHHIQQRKQLLLFGTLPSYLSPQAVHYNRAILSASWIFSSIHWQRFLLGFEIRCWSCVTRFGSSQLALFCHMLAACNSIFHPYHVLGRCTVHDVGNSGISIRGISVEITQTSLTVHISSVQHSFFAFCCVLKGTQSSRQSAYL